MSEQFKKGDKVLATRPPYDRMGVGILIENDKTFPTDWKVSFSGTEEVLGEHRLKLLSEIEYKRYLKNNS